MNRNRVEELRKVRHLIETLKEADKRLSVPFIMNMGVISNLYDIFTLSLAQQDPTADPKDTNNRKKFLYAVLYLLSPATLVGDVMRHKLRESVSAVLGCTPTGVSRDYKTAIFFYATYKDFSESVDMIVNDMLYCLNKEDEE